MLRALAGGGRARPARRGAGGGVSFTYYVDSVNGSDGNAGTSEAEAWQTLSMVPALSAGESVGLARGSEWREEGFESAENGTRVEAYGTGNAPILNGSLIAANAGFSKTGGRTNIYEITVPYADEVGDYPNAWEDGAFLMEADDLTDLDATPGARFFNAGVFYVHPFGSTNPISDGKLYEYSAASVGIELTGDGCRIIGVSAGRQGREGGPLKVGTNGLVQDFETFDTSRHAIVPGAGSVLRNGSCLDMYWKPYTAGGYIVCNSDVFAGETFTVEDVVMTSTAIGRCAIALDAHNSTSGSLSQVNVTRVTATLCDVGIGCDDTDELDVEDCDFNDVIAAVTPFGPLANVANCRQNNTITNSGQNMIVAVNNGQTINSADNICNLAVGRGFIRSTVDGATITSLRDTYLGGVHGGFPLVMIHVKDGTVSVNEADLTDGNGQYAYLFGKVGPFDGNTGTVVYTGDNNHFSPPGLTWIDRDYSDVGLSDWQTFSGQDANSTAS